MGETADRIAKLIDTRRQLLHANMLELEGKVRSVTDWREYLKRHNGIVTALAVGAGFLVVRRIGKKS